MAEEKTTANEEQEKAPKKSTKKVSKSAMEIGKLKEELKNQKELLLRTAAEFDNYKKRTERERITFAEFNKAQLLKIFLPVFDNVERANSADKDSDDYKKGIEMIVKQLSESVGKLGLVTFGEEGEIFDPQLHEAVMHEENEELPENSISAVLQKGYKIGDTVIRPAMVKVAN